MKKLTILLVIACGLIIAPTSATQGSSLWKDAFITPDTGTFLGGLGVFVGGVAPRQYDWTIGNCVPFGTPTDAMVFSTNDTTYGWQERMRITKDGNVGIGTTSPNTTLHISKGNPIIRLTDTNADGRDWGLVSAAAFPGQFGLFDYTAANYRLVVSSTGNVGIGTYSPTGKLHVMAGGEEAIWVDPSIGVVGIGTIHPTKKLEVQWGAGDWVAYIRNTNTTNGYGLLIDAGGTTGGAPLWIRNGSGNNIMFVNYAGNVGIGTMNPTQKLEVEGNVEAWGYITGDVTFQKDGEKLWRMFEEEDGLYLENLKTGKTSRVFLEEDIISLKEEIKELSRKMTKLEETR